MINWGRSFEDVMVYFKPENLITNEYTEVADTLGVTHSPNSNLIPIRKRYAEQDDFKPSKNFLMKRLLQGGYPYLGMSVRPNGPVVFRSAARNVWSGIFYKNQVEPRPSGDCSPVHYEIDRIGKCARFDVEHIVLNDTDEPFLDPVMIITDAWEQESPYLDNPIPFITAYAHINGLPDKWYSQIHLFGYNGKFYLFPDYITSDKTFVIGEKNYVKDVLFNVDNPDFIKIMSKGLFTSDPIWTTQEEIFELQAPLWFSRFKNKIPQVFEHLRTDDGSRRSVMFMVCPVKEQGKGIGKALTAHWIQYPNGSVGYFNGYAYNKATNRLIYGTFEAKEDASGRYVAKPVVEYFSTEIKNEGDNDIVFRPGFKKFYDRPMRDSNDEQFGTRINIPVPSGTKIAGNEVDSISTVSDEVYGVTEVSD